jgi:hypothetical protein
MRNISIKGLIAAVAVAVTLDIAWSVALLFHIAGLTADQAAVAGAVDEYLRNNAYLGLSLVLGLLTTILGGYIVARIAKVAALINAVCFGCIGVAFNLLTAADLPLWFNFLNLLLLIPAAIFGASLTVPRLSAPNA